MGTLGVESYFWKKIAPEATAKAARKADFLRVENQLLTMVHDAIWDVAYAGSGSEHRPPRLLIQLLESIDGPGEDNEKPAVDPAADPDVRAREIAARIRSERAG